jgi:hypothetical protein
VRSLVASSDREPGDSAVAEVELDEEEEEHTGGGAYGLRRSPSLVASGQ